MVFGSIRRVFAIGAHTDDVEYGCLGTLLRLGPDVAKHVFVASVGSAGDTTATAARARESGKALQGLSPDLHIRLEAGISVTDFQAIEHDLHRKLTAADPDLILTLGPEDTHQEHRLMWEITQTAARRSRAGLLQYASVSNTPDFAPNVFIDISAQYDAKLAALAAHKSQACKSYMTAEHLRVFHGNPYAALHGFRCTEAFHVVRWFA